MGGICAVIGDEAEHLVKKMCHCLRHRGPDDEGFYFGQNLALGNRALYIEDTTRVHQPLSNEDETIWITFDGEIYNFETLRKQLEKNHSFHTDSNAEVVVHAYEESGPNCVSEFNGMFAFCLWDSTEGRLFCARDRVGMKPLYYYSCSSRFLLASEIKALLIDPSVPRKPNGRVIHEYLLTGIHSQPENTFFMGIKELLPAHHMFVDKNGIRTRKYWQPLQHLKSDRSIKDDQQYAYEFRKLLRDSVRIRLPKNLPVGTFLSGGIDSTSIVFLVNDILKSNQPTKTEGAKPQEVFSAIYKEPVEQGDERPYIKEVERALKTEINYIFPSVLGKWNDIKRFIFHIDEPVAVFNYYVFWCLSKIARQKVKITFSGQGDDAILGGQTEHCITYFKELWRRKRVATLLNELVKSMDWILPRMVWSILFSRNAESKAKMLLAPRFVAIHSQGETRGKDEASLRSALLSDVTQHAVEYLRVDDRASSAFSIECRHPYLDHRIIELAFSLPATQKIRNGWTKHVMRNAMKGLIPETIRRKRKKLGTPIPQQRWMRDLSETIRKVFNSSKFRERGYFNQPAILKAFDRYCEGKLSRTERQCYTNVLWRILNLELWLEIFFDQQSETELTDLSDQCPQAL